MSALGQKQTLETVRVMSALPPKADIGTQPRYVRFVPRADMAGPDVFAEPNRPSTLDQQATSASYSKGCQGDAKLVSSAGMVVLKPTF
jgi:hypothetical protein